MSSWPSCRAPSSSYPNPIQSSWCHASICSTSVFFWHINTSNSFLSSHQLASSPTRCCNGNPTEFDPQPGYKLKPFSPWMSTQLHKHTTHKKEERREEKEEEDDDDDDDGGEDEESGCGGDGGGGRLLVGGGGGRSQRRGDVRRRGREPDAVRGVPDRQGGGAVGGVLRRREAPPDAARRHRRAAVRLRLREEGGGAVQGAQRRRHPRPPGQVRLAAAVPAQPRLRLQHHSMSIARCLISEDGELETETAKE
uniref:Uncharacterized protein n=1 Tax=Oryza punctata TaxID=4537 RepID=F1BLB0_ORYPU|nr:hypothetical protein [Oryza punctata]